MELTQMGASYSGVIKQHEVVNMWYNNRPDLVDIYKENKEATFIGNEYCSVRMLNKGSACWHLDLAPFRTHVNVAYVYIILLAKRNKFLK